MRALAVSLIAVVGCAEELVDPSDESVAEVVGVLESGNDGAFWYGFETLDLPDPTPERPCRGEWGFEARLAPLRNCAGCELDVEVTETLAVESDADCIDIGLLQDGDRLTFVPTQAKTSVAGAGTVFVDRGNGLEALGSGVLEDSTLTWHRLVRVVDGPSGPIAAPELKDLRGAPIVVAP